MKKASDDTLRAARLLIADMMRALKSPDAKKFAVRAHEVFAGIDAQLFPGGEDEHEATSSSKSTAKAK